jgi:hypothetical protein
VRDVRGRAPRRADHERARVEAVEDRERAIAGAVVAVTGRGAVVAVEERARGGALDPPVERAAVVWLASAAAVRVLAGAEPATAVTVGQVAVVTLLAALDDAVAALAGAGGRAAVAALGVAVVAVLPGIDATVAAAPAAGAVEAAADVTREGTAGVPERLARGAAEVGRRRTPRPRRPRTMPRAGRRPYPDRARLPDRRPARQRPPSVSSQPSTANVATGPGTPFTSTAGRGRSRKR